MIRDGGKGAAVVEAVAVEIAVAAAAAAAGQAAGKKATPTLGTLVAAGRTGREVQMR